MRLPRLAAAAVAAAALAAIAAPTTASAAPTVTERTATGVDVYTSQESDKEIREYWTPERMKRASPMDAPKAKPGKRPVDSPAKRMKLSASAKGVMPKATTTQLNAATATTVSVAQEVPYTNNPAYNTVGKLFFKLPDGSPKECSASSILSKNKNTIWTAGHCVHLGNGSGDAGWMRSIKYVPGYRNGEEPLGSWTAQRMYAPSTWIAEGDTKESDMAAIVLNPVLVYGTLENAVGGALGYQFTENGTDFTDVHAVGYPVEGNNRTDLNGQRMMYCRGNTTDYSSFNPFDDRIAISCDMEGGASGGPYIDNLIEGAPVIIGAVSHHVEDQAGNRVDDKLLSSEHGANAAAVINAANAT
ncbi:hypothetical protein J7E96_29685 [Streptomyces sp. ISL-96]|uniref:trypsin-like serine peptidase n=1 Tax=Streptomyces sp. ISL-96 TaxID=2819191 RepID=UPI001BE519EB|nr:hypothetical protein [Streptomyces sp. ISL-96]MBT2492607.1 hypothetical protein [Streptomyces sp. ISL-96]